MKLTKKQKEIVRYMRDGLPLMIGVSEITGRNYYMIASTHDKGYGNTYFNATVFSNLLQKGIIYFDNRNPEYILTPLGHIVKL